MATPEAKIVAACLKYLRSIPDCWAVKTHGGPLQTSGLPDLDIVLQGHAVKIEVKVPGKSATPLQAHTIEKLRQAGATAAVVHSVEELKEIILGIRKKSA